MADGVRRPLILVADDAPEYRELIPPRLEKDLDARVLVSRTVLDACLAVADHCAGSDDPLDLIVLDMHMPLHEETTEIAMDGGIQFLRSYRMATCPVLVFTAYWSFSDCAKAVRASATAYLPKQSVGKGDGGKDGGINDLVRVCRELLEHRAAAELPPLPPSESWLEQNLDWLAKGFPNSWVAFVDAAAAEAAGINGTEREGVIVVSGPSQECLQRAILPSLPKLRSIPPVVFVPADRS